MSALDELAQAVRESTVHRRLLPAPAGARIGAVVVDLIALAVVLLLASVLAYFIAHSHLTHSHLLANSVMAAAVFLYWSIELILGISPGKWLLDLVVLTPEGHRPPRRRLVVRWLVKSVPILLWAVLVALHILVRISNDPRVWDWSFRLSEWLGLAIMGAAIILGVGFLGVLLPARRTLHDFIAGVSVFREADLVLRAPESHGFAVVQAAPLAVEAIEAVALEYQTPNEPEEGIGGTNASEPH